jgi:hypothetical protein
MTQLPQTENPASSVRREPYAAERTVSPKLHDYFAAKVAKLSEVAGEIGVVSNPEIVESMINAAFWASLRREEGYTPKISIAFLSPNQAGEPKLRSRIQNETGASNSGHGKLMQVSSFRKPG